MKLKYFTWITAKSKIVAEDLVQKCHTWVAQKLRMNSYMSVSDRSFLVSQAFSPENLSTEVKSYNDPISLKSNDYLTIMIEIARHKNKK